MRRTFFSLSLRQGVLSAKPHDSTVMGLRLSPHMEGLPTKGKGCSAFLGVIPVALWAWVALSSPSAATDTPFRTAGASLMVRQRAVVRALAWLHTQQQSDGRFGTSFTVQDAAVTADAVLAIALAGDDPDSAAWSRAGHSALDALETLASGYVGSDAGRAGKVARAIAAAGGCPRDFGGTDYIAIIQAAYDADSGLYHPSILFRHALAVQALAVAQEPIPEKAITAIVETQGRDGGWTWYVPVTRTANSDVDSTAHMLKTLLAAGVPATSTVISEAVAFLAAHQREDGGWGLNGQADKTNANSTALAIQGLVAAGVNPEGPEWNRGEESPLSALLHLQEPSGAFAYTVEAPENRLLATLDALAALAIPYPGETWWLPLPLAIRARDRVLALVPFFCRNLSVSIFHCWRH
jgi:hypothetical protein